MPQDKFSTEEANLLAMSLSDLSQEQLNNVNNLYSLMALIGPEEKEIIGAIEGVQTLPFFSPEFKAFCKSIEPFIIAYGIGKLELSELTGLGLKVGHKNKTETTAPEEEE